MSFALFYLHLPKCAGTTFLKEIEKILPANEIYQSTSLIQNYWHNKTEYICINTPFRLRALVGHWLHEEMLRAYERVMLVTSLREPVARFRSQYNYDMRIAAESGVAMRSREAFLRDNSNVMCTLINATFPSISSQFESEVDSAIKILQSFDYVYDSRESHTYLPKILEAAGFANGAQVAPGRENQSVSVYEIPFDDAEISAATANDAQLYSRFKELQAAGPSDDRNPFFNSDSQQELYKNLGSEKFNIKKIIDYLMPLMVDEYSRFGVLDEFLNKYTYSALSAQSFRYW